MPRRRSKTGWIIGGGIVGVGGLVALLVLLSKGDDDAPDVGENWGVTPPGLRALFWKAEQAAGIPGLGRFLAIWSWGALRANQEPVDAAKAAAIAEARPEFCRHCHNQSASERKASKAALDRVTKPKSQGGAYDDPWPMPVDFDGWADGSRGLFDLLGGSHVHAGYHDGKFAPLVNKPASALFDPLVQCYVAGWIVHRILRNPNLEVLEAGDPADTWANIRAATSTPRGLRDLKDGKNTSSAAVAVKARANFQKRAAELGIDPAAMAMPVDGWPGAATYYSALGL